LGKKTRANDKRDQFLTGPRYLTTNSSSFRSSSGIFYTTTHFISSKILLKSKFTQVSRLLYANYSLADDGDGDICPTISRNFPTRGIDRRSRAPPKINFPNLGRTHLQISCFPISDVLQSHRSTASHLLLSLWDFPILHSHSYISVHLRLSRTHLSHLLLSLPHTNPQDGSQVILSSQDNVDW
jgi:hypothetical protein